MSWAIVVGLISGSAPIIVVIITTIWQNRKLDTIHVLVNSQLTDAMKQIDKLKEELLILKGDILKAGRIDVLAKPPE